MNWKKLDPLKLRRLLQIAIVVLFIAYAFFAANLLSVSSEDLDSSLVKKIVLRYNGRQESADSFGSEMLWARLRTSTHDLARFMDGLIGEFKPVAITIDRDEVDRLEIHNDQIIIGERVAQIPQHWVRSLLQVWVVQNAAEDIRDNPVRCEALADALLAMEQGGLSLEDPRTHQVLDYDALESNLFNKHHSWTWLHSAMSMRGACELGWLPLPSVSLCQQFFASNGTGMKLSTAGARPYLGFVFWKIYRQFSPLQRLDFLREWTHWLAQPLDSSAIKDSPVTNLQTYRGFLQAEFARLWPQARMQSAMQEIADKLLQETFLLRDEFPPLDAWIKLPPINAQSGPRTAAPSPYHFFAALSRNDQEWILTPGQVRLDNTDFEALRARAVIWQECETAKLQEVPGLPPSKLLFFIKNCGAELPVRSYLLLGAHAFAQDFPKIPSIEINRGVLEIRIKQKKLNLNAEVFALQGETDGVEFSSDN